MRGQLCAFPVRIDVTGKSKVIGDLLEDHKTTSPALKVTTTNLTSGESVKYTATGVSRYTVAIDENGVEYFEVVSTGQNLLFSNELGGLFFVRGTVGLRRDSRPAREPARSEALRALYRRPR